MADRSKNPVRDEAGARRLAKAIVSDVRLYNAAKLVEGKVRPGESFAAEVREARELFRSRAVPELDGIFEEAAAELAPVAAIAAVPAGTPGGASEPLVPPPLPGFVGGPPSGVGGTSARDAELERARARLRLVLFLAGAFVAAVVVWLVLR